MFFYRLLTTDYCLLPTAYRLLALPVSPSPFRLSPLYWPPCERTPRQRRRPRRSPRVSREAFASGDARDPQNKAHRRLRRAGAPPARRPERRRIPQRPRRRRGRPARTRLRPRRAHAARRRARPLGAGLAPARTLEVG